MAIKQGESVQNDKKGNGLEGLGLETEYSTSTGSTWKIDVDGLEKISIDELNVGDVVSGMPDFALFDNSNRTNSDGSKRKWDSICLHLADVEETDEYGEQSGEYLVACLPCPRPDAQGNITNIFGNGFYHGCFNLIYSYLRTLDETNVLDAQGNIINNIKKVNIIKLLENLNELSYMEVKVMAGANNDDQYLTFMITDMK